MKRHALLIVAVLAVVLIAATRPPGSPRRQVIDAPLQVVRYRQMTSLSSVTRLPNIPADAYSVELQVESQNVRWRADHEDGTLTTYTDTDTAKYTLEADHGITVSDTVSIWWSTGARHGMSVTAVATNDVTLDGGTGDNLPNDTTLTYEVGVDPTTTVGNIIWAGDWYKDPCDLDRMRFIEEAASAKINVNYRKP